MSASSANSSAPLRVGDESQLAEWTKRACDGDSAARKLVLEQLNVLIEDACRELAARNTMRAQDVAGMKRQVLASWSTRIDQGIPPVVKVSWRKHLSWFVLNHYLFALFRAALAGDSESRDWFAGLILGLVTNTARRLARLHQIPIPESEVEDLISDVMHRWGRVLSHMCQANVQKSWTSYIRRMVVNAAINRHNRQRRPKAKDGQIVWQLDGNPELLNQLVIEDGELPPARLQQRETALLVQEAFSKLDERVRGAWCLYLQGYSYGEIGLALGMTKFTVNNIIHRSRADLERWLRERGLD